MGNAVVTDGTLSDNKVAGNTVPSSGEGGLTLLEKIQTTRV